MPTRASIGSNDAERKPGPITEASCWAHGRRKFFELADVAAKARRKLAVIAPLAFEAVKRIDAIFDIEREINGRSIDERLAVRRTRVARLVSDLETWMRNQHAKLSRRSDVAKAMHYMLTRWDTSPASSMTDESVSSTMRPSVHCAASRLDASPGCSPVRIAAASAPP
jgi:hypothetical protein